MKAEYLLNKLLEYKKDGHDLDNITLSFSIENDSNNTWYDVTGCYLQKCDINYKYLELYVKEQ